MHIQNVHQLSIAIANGPYAWPGGYPIHFLAADGEPMCFECVKLNRAETYAAYEGDGSRDWLIVGAEVNWEDPEMHCAQCEGRIESAYAEDDFEEEVA